MDLCENRRTWRRFAWNGGDAQEKCQRREGGGIKGEEEREPGGGREEG